MCVFVCMCKCVWVLMSWYLPQGTSCPLQYLKEERLCAGECVKMKRGLNPSPKEKHYTVCSGMSSLLLSWIFSTILLLRQNVASFQLLLRQQMTDNKLPLSYPISENVYLVHIWPNMVIRTPFSVSIYGKCQLSLEIARKRVHSVVCFLCIRLLHVYNI